MFLFLSAWMWLLFLFSLVLWPAFFWQEGMLRLLMYGFLGGFLIALFYHLLNGIRHLIWDSGRGLDLPFVHRSGKLVLFGTLLLTGGTLWWIL
jgi:succinate dehydrogenase / fumarate reductase cytochrome b subunit